MGQDGQTSGQNQTKASSMKFPHHRFLPLARILPLLVLTWCAASEADGQISSIKKAVEATDPAKPAPPADPADDRKRLEGWLQEARETLSRLEAAGTNAGLPEGITPWSR